MLKKNEEYIVDIIDNGYQGEGIAKIDNFIIFVDQAIKGETIRIRILKVQSDLCFAKILEIIKPAKSRQEADCKTYKKCGGCNLRHMSYESTLEVKKQIVETCLYKALKRKIEVNEIIGMKNPLYYRNKLQYPLGLDENKNPVMGVYSTRTHNIVKTEKCYIQNELCEKIAKDIFEFIKTNKIKVYDEKSLKGTIRHIVVRIGINTKEVLVTLVLNDKNFNKEKELVDFITKKHKEIKSIVKNYNSKNTNVIFGKDNETIYGDGYIYDILGDYKFKISPLSFYQVNPIQAEVLYNTALSYVDKKNKKIAIDLYCGIGTISIFAAKQFSKVYGIEIVEDAIKDAKENAIMNKIENTEFLLGDVEEVLPKLIEKEKIKPDVVFVDPPRKGLDKKTISTLIDLEPKEIIYISCNPATLARDISALESKYELKKAQPFDMFPYTNHVEAVTSLSLK